MEGGGNILEHVKSLNDKMKKAGMLMGFHDAKDRCGLIKKLF